MGANTFRHVVGSVKMLSVVMGAAAAVAMGALCVIHGSDAVNTSVARTDDPPVATVTRSATPRELATSFARPTHTAKPCAARATMPC